MDATTKHEEWKQDAAAAAAAADPAVLPEYTLLPSSPSVSSPPNGRLSAVPSASDSAPSTPATESPPFEAADGRPHSRSEARRILRAIMHGLLAIVLPPVVVAGAAVAAGFAVIYGVGKMLEGMGRGLAAGPEALYKACAGKKVRAAWRAVRGKTPRAEVEAGAISI